MSDRESRGPGDTGGSGVDKGKGACGEPEHLHRSDGWWEERALGEKIVLGIGFGILGVGLLFLFGLVVMALWNWLMPDIFGLKRVSYWQAWGLLVLSCILFGKMGSGRSGGGDRKRKRKLRSYMREEQAATGEGTASSPNA